MRQSRRSDAVAASATVPLGERLDDLAKQDKQVAGALSSVTGSMIWNTNTQIYLPRVGPARVMARYES
jgi:hypothetical protein